MSKLVLDLMISLAYCGVGVLLMAIGYVLVDVATPGRLKELIWVDRNHNAALLLASNLVGVGIIVVAAIFASPETFPLGIVGAAAYGLLGLVVMAAAFVLLDIATPGKLGRDPGRPAAAPGGLDQRGRARGGGRGHRGGDHLMSASRRIGVARALVGAVTVLALGGCGVGDNSTVVPPPTREQNAETVEVLRRSAAEHGICYGWELFGNGSDSQRRLQPRRRDPVSESPGARAGWR